MLKFQIVPLFLVTKMIIKGLEFRIGDAYVIKKLHPSIILILAIFFDAISSCCSHCCWLSGPCFHYWSCHIPIIKAKCCLQIDHKVAIVILCLHACLLLTTLPIACGVLHLYHISCHVGCPTLIDIFNSSFKSVKRLTDDKV